MTEKTQTRFALIIANYEYQDDSLQQLIAPAQDAEALARVLDDETIGDFQVKVLVNYPSHKVRIEIASFFVNRKRDDLLLLYFSGHGVKDDDGRLYLTTADTQRNLLRATAIPATFVNETMAASRSRCQILVLDCCHSGAFARGMVAKGGESVGIRDRFEGRGRVVLTASKATQYAFQGDQIIGEGSRSVFTHHLVQGLETGEADLDGDGWISLDELYDYVYDRVTDETPRQTPGKWVFDLQGNIVVARNPHSVVKLAELPPMLQQAIESLHSEVREGAVRQLDHLLRGNDKNLVLAAQIALKRLANDDSYQVADAAVSSLAMMSAASSVLPRSRIPITPHNASRIVELTRLGRGTIEEIALNPDGDTLAVAGSLGVYLYNVETLEPLRLFEGHTNGALSVSWSPDGKLLASGDRGKAGRGPTAVRIWDAASGQEVHVLTGHRDGVGSIAWSPDCQQLASAGRHDHTVRIWDTAHGRQLRMIESSKDYLRRVAWSPDGTQIVSVQTKTVRVWDAASGKELYVSQSHADVEGSVAWSPTGGLLELDHRQKGKVREWDVTSGQELRVLKAIPYLDFLTSAAWSPDGTQVVLGVERDHDLQVWDIANGEKVCVLKGHQHRVNAFAWFPDGSQLITGSQDGTVRIWDLARGQQLRMLRGHTSLVNSVAWSPDSTQLVSAGLWGGFVWDVTRGQQLRALEGAVGRVESVAWSPDGGQLAAAANKIIWVWDAVSGQQLQRLQMPVGSRQPGLRGVAWSPDGTRLAAACQDGTMQVWDATSGQLLDVLKCHLKVPEDQRSNADSVAWSPDGTRLVSGHWDQTVRVWDAVGGSELRVLEGHMNSVHSVAWSPDGALLASGSLDRTVQVWDAANGRQLRVLRGHIGSAQSVAWSPDGTLLASGSGDLGNGTIRVWDVASGRQLCVLAGHTYPVQSVAWSPDSTMLASGSEDTTVRVWGIAFGDES